MTQLEIMPMPPKMEDKMLNWPNWPVKLRTSSSHEEGAERDFAVMTRKFEGENGVVTGIECVRVDDKMKPIEGSEFTLKADLVLLAMGFVSPVNEGMLERTRRQARPARQCRGRHARLRLVGRQGVRLRRHAARPVAGGLGDPRGAPMRGVDRRGADGIDSAAALRASLVGAPFEEAKATPCRRALPQRTLTTRNVTSSPSSSRIETYSPSRKAWSAKRKPSSSSSSLLPMPSSKPQVEPPRPPAR